MGRDILVRKSNSLIRAGRLLDRAEAAIFGMLASKLGIEDTEFISYTICSTDIAEYLGRGDDPVFRDFIFTKMKGLIRRVDINQRKSVALIAKAEYNPESKEYTLMFHKDMEPYLLQLNTQGGFTKYEKGILPLFRSAYSHWLYEFLLIDKFRARPCVDSSLCYNVEIGVSELRAKLGVADGVHRKFSEFNREVLSQVVREINTLSELLVSYTYKKVDRFVVGIIFKMTTISTKKVRRKSKRTCDALPY